MRLLNSHYNIEIEFFQSEPLCICIESPGMLRDFLTDLWSQSCGSAGNFILSRDGKEIPLSKGAELIMNPFAVNFNDKKIVNKLYQELEKIVTDDCFDVAEEINSQIISFLDLIVEKLPYRIEFELELDAQALMKMYKVRFEEEFDKEFLEKLTSYIKLIHKVCGIECFVTYNLKQLLTQDELTALYRDLLYEQIYIMDIEGAFTYKVPEESCIIIDKDECLIQFD